MRIRKAWMASVSGLDGSDLVYAETASKARYSFWLGLRDSYENMKLMDVTIRRAAHNDVTLPAPHRIIDDLTPQQRRMISHAFGQDRHGNGYRDHYCAATCDLLNAARLTWEFGIFAGPFGEKAYGETPGWSGSFFYLTDFGKHVAASMLPTYGVR